MRLVILMVGVLTLAACGERGDPQLFNLRTAGPGPDEFAILPSRPLEIPEDVAALPLPTPGEGNLTDQRPEEDVILALGGSLEGGFRGDAGLTSYVTRYGIEPDIRSQLADADLEFRRQNPGRLLERVFNLNNYYIAYETQQLDQYGELERFRAAGVRTPAVPPPPF